MAVDATSTHSMEEDYSDSCLVKTSKNGVSSYSYSVLEAKLVPQRLLYQPGQRMDEEQRGRTA